MCNEKYQQGRAQKKAEETAKSFRSAASVRQDPSGSYTGTPKEKHDRPEQDADDL